MLRVVRVNETFKKVINLLKYLRDLKAGPMQKIWSHLIKVLLTYVLFKSNILTFKTSTMNLVMERSVAFWNNENLVLCFVQALSYLTEGLERKDIRDVFFPEVNKKVNNY